MFRAFPVDDSPQKSFFRRASRKITRAALWTCFRTALRLFARRDRVQFEPLPTITTQTPTPVTTAVHRFEESIAGRSYLIEVRAVSTNRWRAYIVRIPGVPTALMPFYGDTPSEAAHLLCDWLTRAHARAANPAGTV